MTKKEYPTIDNYLIWLMAVDYMMEELELKEDKKILENHCMKNL